MSDILFDLIDEDGVTVQTATVDTEITLLTLAGPTGPTGLPGADSTVPGPAGPAGADSTVPGPQGEVGPQGDPGSTTIAGIAGLQTSLDGKEVITNRGAVSGYAPLDSSQLVPSIYLPSYVDDVVEHANLAAFPGTGTTGKIYVALDSNKTYRWSGSAYVEVSPGPGSTDSVTEGSTNLYYTQARADARITAATGVTVQPLDSDLTALAALTDPATKLAGIATGATANSTDAQLRDRATHTGTQPVSSLTATGTASSATYLRGDGAWSTPAGGGGDVTLTGAQTLTQKTIGDKLDVTAVSTPATPSAGTARLYARTGVSGIDALAYLTSVGVPIVLGRDVAFYAKNTSGSTIAKGSVVYVSSATSSTLFISKAQADAGMTKLPAVGLVTADITNNTFGMVLQAGLITGVDTSGMGDGSTLYASATTAGAFTSTAPTHPSVEQAIGLVVNANVSGSILVTCCNAINLHRIDGVNGASFAIGDGTGSGTKSVQFKNANTGTLSMTPTGARTVTVPDATTTLVGRDTTDTLTLKRITKRVLALSNPGATPTINTDLYDAVEITGQTADITSITVSGTPTAFQQLRVSYTGTAARAITHGASFEAGPVALPTTTVTTQRLDVLYEWRSGTSKWRCMASGSAA